MRIYKTDVYILGRNKQLRYEASQHRSVKCRMKLIEISFKVSLKKKVKKKCLTCNFNIKNFKITMFGEIEIIPLRSKRTGKENKTRKTYILHLFLLDIC